MVRRRFLVEALLVGEAACIGVAKRRHAPPVAKNFYREAIRVLKDVRMKYSWQDSQAVDCCQYLINKLEEEALEVWHG